MNTLLPAAAYQFPRRLVILESRYAGNIELNERYARRAIRDSILRGESPICSHLLYTQPGILDDTIPAERTLGMEAFHEWYRVAEACVIYDDYGISSGMQAGLNAAAKFGVPVEWRTIGYEP